MAKKTSTSTQTAPSLQTPAPGPLPDDERLFVGIDVGKEKLYGALCSGTLLKIHRDWKHTPWLEFARTREGFETLRIMIEQYAPLDRATLLFESTGPYSRAVQDYFTEELGVTCYRKHVRARPDRLVKSDKRDAQALASHLYNLLEKGMQAVDRTEEIRQVTSDVSAAAKLKPLVHHRQHLVQQTTRTLNQLTAICDELFPEFTQHFKDPNGLIALSIRDHFPTLAAIEQAQLADLQIIKRRGRPSDKNLLALQATARASIGLRQAERATSLAWQQKQLIILLRTLQTQLEETEAEIERLISQFREGQILLSIPCLGPIRSAIILASIRSVENFPTVAKLKAYCGWAPKQAQTGSTLNQTTPSKEGNRILKQAIFLTVMSLIRIDEDWRTTYESQVARKCAQNNKGEYVGKMRIVTATCGKVVTIIYTLLRQDADLLAGLQPGDPIPDPKLYDRTRHQGDRAGQYIQQRKQKHEQTKAVAPL